MTQTFKAYLRGQQISQHQFNRMPLAARACFLRGWAASEGVEAAQEAAQPPERAIIPDEPFSPSCVPVETGRGTTDASAILNKRFGEPTEEERREEIARLERSYRIIDPNAPPLFPPSDEPPHVQEVRRRAREYRTVRRVALQYTAGDWVLAAALVALIVGLVGAMWGGWR